MSNCSSCGGDIRITINNGYATTGYNTSTLCNTCSTSSTSCSTCSNTCTCSTCNNCTTECPGGTTYTSCVVYNGDDLDCLDVPITTATELNTVIEGLATAICALETGGVPDLCAAIYANCDTDNLPEGAVNFYYTDARVEAIAWLTVGNTGTADVTNFLGTLDSVPLNFRVNNVKSGRIDHLLFNTFFGYRAGLTSTTGNKNTYLGAFTGSVGTINTNNVCVGYGAGSQNVASSITFVGYSAGNANTSGIANTGIGNLSLAANTIGTNNTGLGNLSLRQNTTGTNNTAIGATSLPINTTGQKNTALGSESLAQNIAGTGNVALGYQAGYFETGNNALYIDNDVRANLADGKLKALVYGNFNAVTTSQFFNINGTLGLIDDQSANYTTFTGGNQAGLDIDYVLPTAQGGVNTVLNNDGAGVLSWGAGAVVAPGWLLAGNAGTIDLTNFVGTTDITPLNFKVNNQKAGRISSTGATFYGYQAGNVNSSNLNTGVGYKALSLNTIGNSNVAVGYESLLSNTTGVANTAVGMQSSRITTIGQSNTSVGNYSLGVNINGSSNTAIGSFALSGYTANYSTAVGAYSSQLLTTGLGNTSLGYATLATCTTGFSNTAIGTGALANNTGSNNTAVGRATLGVNTTGADGVAIGTSSLQANTTGTQNTAVGSYSLATNIIGNYNSTVGYGSLQNNTSNNNSALGYQALTATTVGDNNSAVGYQSGIGITSGTDNIIIGASSGVSIVTGSNNTIIGANVDSGSDVSDTVIIGIGDGTIKLSIGLLSIADVLNIAYVPTFADDAAAAVGLLVSGDVYKTTTGGSTFLKIVP